MSNDDVTRLMRYVISLSGDGCGMCVGETIYRYYCEFYKDIDMTLDDLHAIVNDARRVYYDNGNPADPVLYVSAENGTMIPDDNDKIKKAYIVLR